MLQVVPSQGYPVQPGSSYTLRIAVADANHGLVDSVLLLPAGAVRLAPGPTAVTGGPYAVVRKLGWWSYTYSRAGGGAVYRHISGGSSAELCSLAHGAQRNEQSVTVNSHSQQSQSTVTASSHKHSHMRFAS